ncbi:D-alanyl-D-alanine carboxypeptidase [Lachnospiraceae bacterium NSJ-143]|nr:D-alanyl-D-alanine carboxypeptidase [Lachnospiraceae bacterium NSJ-143]
MKNLRFCTLIITSMLLTIPAATAYSTEIPQSIQQEADSLELDADAAILIDASTGDILYEKNINKKEYPASITKLMTMLLAFENCKMEDTITFSKEAVFSIEPGSSHIGIDQGEKITVDQAMYAIMLQSANEVSNGVAEHIDGSLEAFAKHMTQRAKELGAKNTNFVNANGLHDENHYTTAYDMSLIARELLKYPHFKDVLSTTYYEIPPTNIQPETRFLHGQTQLIKSASIFYYENCEGGKTGFTDQAGNTLVAYAQKDGTELISVVLKSTGYGEYTDTIKLFDYGLNNFTTQKLCQAGTLCRTAQAVSKGLISDQTEEVKGVYARDINVTLPKTYSAVDIKTEINIPATIEAPVKKGDIIGSAVYTLNESEIGKTDIIAENDALLEEAAPVMAKAENKKPINLRLAALLLACVLFAMFIIHALILKIRYENRRKKRRERLKRYRETNFQDIELSPRSRKYR